MPDGSDHEPLPVPEQLVRNRHQAAVLHERRLVTVATAGVLRADGALVVEVARARRAEMRARIEEARHSLHRLQSGVSGQPTLVRPALSPASAATTVDDGSDVEALHRRYAVTRDRRRRDQLALHYDDFAVSLARRFPSRREHFDDLAQVARIGLLKSIDRFDPHRRQPFMGFARATIAGELKRHIRDKTWSLRVPRSLQEHYLAVVRAVDDLSHELGRSPTIAELAGYCHLTHDEVVEAMELGMHQRPASLDAPSESGRVIDPGDADPAIGAVENRELTHSLLRSLPPQERQILRLRFEDGLTQREIAEKVGMSQMYISRLLARVLERLRTTAGAT